MSAPFIVRLSGARHFQWLDAQGELRSGSPAELAAVVNNGARRARQTLLVVPGEQLSILPVRLPGRQRQRWRQALRFALEERLADPIETLHAAPGERRYIDKETRASVAVVDRERLQAWLDVAAEAALSLTAVIPDTLLLPRYDDAWSLLIEDRRCVLRCTAEAGFCCDRTSLPALLKLAVGRASTAPPQLAVWGEPPPELLDAAAQLAPLTLIRQPPAAALLLYAQAYARDAGINLLQDEFAAGASDAGGAWGRRWRFAAALSGVLLTLQLVELGLDYFSLSREQATLRARIEDAFHTALPGARLVDPRIQLSNRLREQTDGSGEPSDDFLALLAVGGESLRALPAGAVTLRGLRFDQRRLELLLQGRNLEDFDKLRQLLGDRTGVRAELTTSKRDNTVESRLSLSRS